MIHLLPRLPHPGARVATHGQSASLSFDRERLVFRIDTMSRAGPRVDAGRMG